MNALRDILSNFSIFAPLSLAVTIPWIVFKILGRTWLKKSYNTLNGKVIVITGASSGLGEALAHEFYRYGAQVVLCARRRQELERVRSDLLHTHCKDTTHPPIIIPLNLNNFDQLKECVEKILTITSRIDILINCGGISHRGTVCDTTLDVYQRIMSVNYIGTLALTKAVLSDMVRKKSGHIVFISSVQGLVALPERSAYSASKHALQAFADSLRAEIASKDISVTVISPGYIKTSLSLNALTSNGDPHGIMDVTTESGYSPEYAAKKIVTAVVQKKKEIILSSLLPRLAVFIRKYLPFLYFYIMNKRAQKKQI